MSEIDKKIASLSREKADLLEKENKRRQREIADMEAAEETRRKQDDAARDRARLVDQSGNPVGPDRYGASSSHGLGSASPGSRSEAMRFFMKQGWSRQQAAGIVANLVAESGLRAGNIGDKGQAYGIAQWHPDRQADFARWAGKNIRGSSFEEQLAFIQYELTRGKEAPAGHRLRGARSAREAGAIVSRYYERPDLAEVELSKRSAMAERIGFTPMPEDAKAALQDSRPDSSKASIGPLSGEMSLSLDLSPDAHRLLQAPAVVPTARFGPSMPFGASR